MKGWLQRRFGCTGLRIPLPGPWQVELWLAPRGAVIPPHTHPHIVSRLVFLAGRMGWQRGAVSREFNWRDFGRSFLVPPDCVHGAVTLGAFGLFLNLEHWLPGAAKTSAAVDLEMEEGMNLEGRKA